jgi:hypothetical protein
MIIRHDLTPVLGRRLPITILTDYLSLFDVLSKASTTAEKRLMIDLEAAKAAYATRELEHVGFIRTQHNRADVFTKVGRCAALEDILKHGILDHPIEQWILRSPAPS